MSLSRFLLAVGCVIALLLNGCGKSSNDNANVRVLNLISGANDLNVTVGGVTVLTNASFESLGGFNGVGSGNEEFKVTIAGSAGNLIDTIYTLGGDVDYSYITNGTPGAATAVLIADPYGSPGSNVAVRVLNLSLVFPFIDVYLTPPGADIATATPVLSGGSYSVVTTFVNTTPGDLELRITSSGSKDVIYDAPVTLAPGTGQTVVAYGKGSSKLVNVALLASNTSGAIVNSQLAQFKVANGTAVPAPVNVLVDGAAAMVEPRVCHRRALPDAGVGRATDHGRIVCRPGCDTFVDCAQLRARDRHVDRALRCRRIARRPRARRFESSRGARARASAHR